MANAYDYNYAHDIMRQSRPTQTPHILYVVSYEGLVFPMHRITAMSDKQFKDEDGVISELKQSLPNSSDIIYIKYEGAVHAVKVTEEWIKPMLGHNSYDMYYNKYVIFNSWVSATENKNETNHT